MAVSVIYKNILFINSFLVFNCVIVAMMIATNILCKRYSYGASPISPYAMPTNCVSFTDYSCILGDSTQLYRLPNGVLCARSKEKRHYICYFIYYMKSFNQFEYKTLETNAISMAIEAGIVPSIMSREDFFHSVRCNIIVTDEINLDAYELVSRNAVNRLHEYEGIIDSVVSLKTGTAYIPALWGGYAKYLRKYKIVVEKLFEITQ